MRSTSSRTGLALATLVSLGLAASSAHAQTTPILSNTTTLASLTAGNLVISRVNNGSAVTSVNSGYSTSVYLDEYTTAGNYLGTIALPSGGTNAFTLSNSATSEGALTLSANSASMAQVLTISGYNAAAGTAAIASTKTTGLAAAGTTGYNREVDVVATSGTSTLVSQGPTDFSGNNIRSAVSTNGSGTTIYSDGASTGVVETNGGTQTTVSTTNTNERVLNIFNGGLYYSTGSGGATGTGIYQVGTGLPTTTGNAGTQIVNTTSSPYDFYFADANDVYVADSTAGLEKYTKNASGVFGLSYASAASGLTGLTAVTNAGVTTLYGVADAATNATTTANATNSNTLYSFIDNGSGFTSKSLVTLNTNAAGANNYAFRGVDFAPSLGTPSAAPEPAQTAGIGFFVAGLAGLILKARKRTAAKAA